MHRKVNEWTTKHDGLNSIKCTRERETDTERERQIFVVISGLNQVYCTNTNTDINACINASNLWQVPMKFMFQFFQFVKMCTSFSFHTTGVVQQTIYFQWPMPARMFVFVLQLACENQSSNRKVATMPWYNVHNIGTLQAPSYWCLYQRSSFFSYW